MKNFVDLIRFPALVFVFLLLFGGANGWSQAQLMQLEKAATDTQSDNIELPKDLTPETVRQLVATMSDEQVRELLLQRLDAVAKSEDAVEPENATNVFDFFTSSLDGVGRSIVDAVQKLPLIASSLYQGFQAFSAPRGVQGVIVMFATMIVAICAGLIVEYFVSRFTRKWREQIAQKSAPEGLGKTLELLVKRFVLDMLGLAAFFAVTRAFIELMVPVLDRPLMPLFMVNLVVVPRLFGAMLRFLLAPWQPNLRLVHTDDWTAKYLYWNQLGIVILIGMTAVILQFQNYHGIPMGQAKIGFWMVLVTFSWLGYTLYRARAGLTTMLLGEDDDATPAERLMAKAYPWVAIGLVVMCWILGEVILVQGRFDLLRDGQQYITLGVLLAAPALDTMVRGLVRHLVPPMRGDGLVAQLAYQSTKRSYIRIGRALLTVATIIVIAEVWNVDFENLASAGLGTRIAATLFENLFILASGYLVWEIVSLWLNRKLADEQTAAGMDLESEEPGGGEGGGVGGSRLSTVLPLLKLGVQVAIITMTVLIALGNLGIDITPLLAGAGIIGLAIGFGAQTLVRDIVSGLFFLLDDAFRVGEYLEIDGTVGTVERISIRSLQLRHHQGPVHTIPYGEIPMVTNNSRDWVIVKLKFTVPFDTDVNVVKKLFKQIGKEIMDAAYAEDIIQTFKSQGVYDVNDVGIVVRGKFMAKPGKQWMIRKDVYARVQKIFAENNIEFARREVRVKMPESEDGQETDDKSSLAAAASQAVVDQQLEEEMQAGAPGKA